MVVLTSFTYPNSPIRYEQRNTRALLDKVDLGLGTLYISESAVSWKEQGDDTEKGFSLSYHHISLHATSTDPNIYPRECIYVMIDTRVTLPGQKVEEKMDDKSDSEDESEADLSELILVPGDPSALNPMYEALKECQVLNPDPADTDSEEDDVYEDADEDLQVREYVQNVEDIGGGGDTAVDHLAQRLVNMTYEFNNGEQNYEYNNGEQNYEFNNGEQNDEEFEDAD